MRQHEAQMKSAAQTVAVRILVVDDEVHLAALVQRGLEEAGHQVDTRLDGTSALTAVRAGKYDAVVLDWMLPGLDGPQVLAALRAAGDRTPVLMLTARHSVPDRVAGLEAGADDYLAKPFVFDELLARLRALARRAAADEAPAVAVGDLRLDLERRSVTRAGQEVVLSAREFDVLALLARRAGRCVTRLQILDDVWDGETDLRSNVIDVYIATLRAKVDRPFGRNSIRTLRGAGYTLTED